MVEGLFCSPHYVSQIKTKIEQFSKFVGNMNDICHTNEPEHENCEGLGSIQSTQSTDSKNFNVSEVLFIMSQYCGII